MYRNIYILGTIIYIIDYKMGDYKINIKDIMSIKRIKTLIYLKKQHPPDEALIDELIKMEKEELSAR